MIEEELKERESLAFINLFSSPVLLSCSADPLMLNPCRNGVGAASSVRIIMQSRCSVTPKYQSSAILHYRRRPRIESVATNITTLHPCNHDLFYSVIVEDPSNGYSTRTLFLIDCYLM